MTARVFVASLPTRYDAATKEHVPSLDLNPATEHGELVILTEGPRATGDELDRAIYDVDERLDGQVGAPYNYKQGDSILMVGDPILNAAAVNAGLNAGFGDDPVTVLRWDRKKSRYDRVEIPA